MLTAGTTIGSPWPIEGGRELAEQDRFFGDGHLALDGVVPVVESDADDLLRVGDRGVQLGRRPPGTRTAAPACAAAFGGGQECWVGEDLADAGRKMRVGGDEVDVVIADEGGGARAGGVLGWRGACGVTPGRADGAIE